MNNDIQFNNNNDLIILVTKLLKQTFTVDEAIEYLKTDKNKIIRTFGASIDRKNRTVASQIINDKYYNIK